MKKILLLALLTVVAASTLNAQKKNAIKIRPLALGLGSIDGMYERAIGGKMSVSLQLSYMKWNVLPIAEQYYSGTGTLNSASLTGYMVTPQFRFYPAGNAIKGFYINPFLQRGKYTLAQSNTDQYNFQSSSNASLTVTGIGVGIGYQWTWGPVCLDWNFLGLGVQSWGLGFEYQYATADNISNANDIVTNLNNSAFFKDYTVKFPSSGGIEVSAPVIGILPTFKSNLSLGIAF
jgi:type II secretory pathway pseudopilin PulG